MAKSPKISQFFPQHFPDFPKVSPHDNIFSTNIICDICGKYELYVILLIVSLDVTSPEGGDHLGEGTVSLQTWLYLAPHFQLECKDLSKSIPLSAELQHYRVGRRPPWTRGNVLQAQRWSRVWDLGGEFVCSPVSPFLIMKVPWFTFYFLCGYHSSFIFSVGLPWLGQWALADALCHLRGTDLVH